MSHCFKQKRSFANKSLSKMMLKCWLPVWEHSLAIICSFLQQIFLELLTKWVLCPTLWPGHLLTSTGPIRGVSGSNFLDSHWLMQRKLVFPNRMFSNIFHRQQFASNAHTKGGAGRFQKVALNNTNALTCNSSAKTTNSKMSPLNGFWERALETSTCQMKTELCFWFYTRRTSSPNVFACLYLTHSGFSTWLLTDEQIQNHPIPIYGVTTWSWSCNTATSWPPSLAPLHAPPRLQTRPTIRMHPFHQALPSLPFFANVLQMLSISQNICPVPSSSLHFCSWSPALSASSGAGHHTYCNQALVSLWADLLPTDPHQALVSQRSSACSHLSP